MAIGKVVHSNSHIDYICQVFGPGEITTPPSPEDYAFGTFVRVPLEGAKRSQLVGIVYNTMLMNPEFGNLGPRLSPASDLAIFSPDYLSERGTLIGIMAVGSFSDEESCQGVPLIAAQIGAPVERMTDDEIRQFHKKGANLRLGYIPVLLAQQNPLAVPLVLNILARIETLIPNERAQTRVLKNDLAWKFSVQSTSR